MVEAGFDDLEPLIDFRDWLASIRNKPERRMSVRRSGKAHLKPDGKLIPGPFTLATRREILAKLQETQEQTDRRLVSDNEIDLIHQIWADDAIRALTIRLAGLREAKIA